MQETRLREGAGGFIILAMLEISGDFGMFRHGMGAWTENAG